MAEALYGLLMLQLEPSYSVSGSISVTTQAYLDRLTTLPLTSLTGSEPESLAQNAQSLHLSLQALASRSHKQLIFSSTELSSLGTTLPDLASTTSALHDAIPQLDAAVLKFADTYSRRRDDNEPNPALESRRKALLLSRDADHLSDILDLPNLLSTAISSATGPASSGYSSALDLNAHIRRLHALYPTSPIMTQIAAQADVAMQAMVTNLIASLKSPNLKLAVAMRTVSWLRRVAPDLVPIGQGTAGEGSIGSLFLLCRLSNLMSLLGALKPLRVLADQEVERSGENGGQQTERYLKRYVEIFREQSFAIISMYRSIFPKDSRSGYDRGEPGREEVHDQPSEDALIPLPSAVATFPIRLVSMLLDTLRAYLPVVRDWSSRESLLTQVLYCAGSLGRLGGDFSLMLSFLEEEGKGQEWVEASKKHRLLAGRLEGMVGGGYKVKDAGR